MFAGCMFAGHLTRAMLRGLDWLAGLTLASEDMPEHQRTGRRGEEDAYFYLRRRGYTIIARNYRSRIIADSIWLAGTTMCSALLK